MSLFLIWFVIPYIVNFILFFILQAVLWRNWNRRECIAGLCFSLFSYITSICLNLMYVVTIIERVGDGVSTIHEKKTIQREIKKKVLRLRGSSRFEMMDFDE